jgi:CRISPR-associated endonuclease/helicase Cas3
MKDPTRQVAPSSFPLSPSDPAAKAASELWAKFQDKAGDGKEESIPWHTDNVLTVYHCLRQRFEPLLDEGQAFWRDLYIALLFHDTGKFVRNFQDENRKRAHGGSPDWERYIRHEFISCLLLLDDYTRLCGDRPEALFAVAAHHKPLHGDLFRSEDDRTGVDYKVLDYREEDLRAIEGWLADRLQSLGIEWSLAGRASEALAEANGEQMGELRRYFTNTVFGRPGARRSMLTSYLLEHPERKRLSYARFLGLLHACDWAGSGRSIPSPPLSYGEKDLRRIMEQKPYFKDWLAFQLKSGAATGNVLAIAPTGSGKTEAALLWAANRPPGTRIFYCLPTKVTSNAIFRRLQEFFPVPDQGSPRVGVVHSGAKHYRILSDKDEYDERGYLTDRSFGREITVSTIDQLLTMGYNLGHWQMKTLYATQAAVIIDEIHLYEPFTLGLIIRTIEYLRENCGAAFYIMTATLPDKLKILLRQALEDKVTLIEDTEKRDQARNVWEYMEADLGDDTLMTRIRADIIAGKKVLVVRNTVDDCVATYNLLKSEVNDSEQRRCLHSRFTTIDRLEKEEKVISLKENDPFLLVSTQVVEVSLDIDFDVLYTENAPIDALIQRAGRVNRKGKKEGETRVIVFKASENSVRMYGKEIADLLTRTAEELVRRQSSRIQEGEMIDMVNAVYADYDVTESTDYRKGYRAYDEVQKHLKYIFDNRQLSDEDEAVTRAGLNSISVIPHQFKSDLVGKKLAEKVMYQIGIRPKQYARLPIREKDEEHEFLTYVEAEYNQDTGLYIPSWDEFNQSQGTVKSVFS